MLHCYKSLCGTPSRGVAVAGAVVGVAIADVGMVVVGAAARGGTQPLHSRRLPRLLLLLRGGAVEDLARSVGLGAALKHSLIAIR